MGIDKRAIEAETSRVGFEPASTVNNYHGPVVTVNGDYAQLAWENDSVDQTQNRVEQIAPGYEQLAQLLSDLLANLNTFEFAEDDAVDAKQSAETVLKEVVKAQPDQHSVRRGVNMLKGLFAPIATGAVAAVSAESAEAARILIELLGTSLPF